MRNDSGDRERTTDLGVVKISNDAIAAIAHTAAMEIKGVAKMGGGISRTICDMLTKRSPSRGIRIKVKEGEIRISVFVVVEYGVDIPRIADEVQENVKRAVEKMAGLVLSNVDVVVEGVSSPAVDKNARRPV